MGIAARLLFPPLRSRSGRDVSATDWPFENAYLIVTVSHNGARRSAQEPPPGTPRGEQAGPIRLVIAMTDELQPEDDVVLAALPEPLAPEEVTPEIEFVIPAAADEVIDTEGEAGLVSRRRRAPGVD